MQVGFLAVITMNCQTKCNKYTFSFSVALDCIFTGTENAPCKMRRGVGGSMLYFVALMLTAALCAEFALEFDAQTALTL